MNAKTLEKWTWVLIYGGILLFSLGWFLREASPAVGWTMKLAGAIAVAAGAVLIWLRSRLPR